MTKIIKVIERYVFSGLHGIPSICQLEISDNVVICTELEQNEGTSVTNRAEYLIETVCTSFKIDRDRLRWFEINGDCAEVFYDGRDIRWDFVPISYAYDVLNNKGGNNT